MVVVGKGGNNEKIMKRRSIELPMIDLMGERCEVSKVLVKACDEYGFFKVVNHRVPQPVITEMEEQSWQFFSKTTTEKQTAGPPNPYGYGSKTIGFNGDVGEVEYLLLKPNSPPPPPPHATNHPTNFRYLYIYIFFFLLVHVLDYIYICGIF